MNIGNILNFVNMFSQDTRKNVHPVAFTRKKEQSLFSFALLFPLPVGNGI